MKIRTRVRPYLLGLTLVSAPVITACATAPAAEPQAQATVRGAELWRQACNRCHVRRPPRQFTAEQWPVIVNHMRSRAALTRSEAEAVAAFLREASSEGDDAR